MRNLRRTASPTLLILFMFVFGLLAFILTLPAGAADPKCIGVEDTPTVLAINAPEGWFEYCTPRVDSNGNVYPERTEVDGVVANDYPMTCDSTEVDGPVLHTSAPAGPSTLIRATVPLSYDRWLTIACTNAKGVGPATAVTLVRFPLGGTPGAPAFLPAD
jgi:hypothetical protein